MCVPGQELALLVRVAVDREVEQVGADAAVVEQRVALARARRSRRSACPRAGAAIRNSSSLHLVSSTCGGEAAVPLERVEAERPLALGQLRHALARPGACCPRRAPLRVVRAASRRGSSARRRRRPRARGPRAPSGPSGTRSTRSARGRSCRTGCPRRAAAGAAPRRSRTPSARAPARMPPTKSFRSGTCAMTLLATSRSARRPSADEAGRELAAEERDDRLDAALARRLGDVRGGLDAERRNAALDDVLQQVAVVARQLHHEAVRVEPEALHRHLHVVARVRDPGVGVRREVGVLAEDVARRSRTPRAAPAGSCSQTCACSG